MITEPDDYASGLSKRELFAAMALQGLLAYYSGAIPLPSTEEAAKNAVTYADGLIEALNAQKEDPE